MHVISNGAKYIDLKRLKQQNTTHRDEFKGCKGVKHNRATDVHFPLL